MHYSAYAAALMAALPFASAVGQARVNNFCPQQICVYDGSNGKYSSLSHFGYSADTQKKSQSPLAQTMSTHTQQMA